MKTPLLPLIAAACLAATAPASAAMISHGVLDWTGQNGYRVVVNFAFDPGPDPIRDATGFVLQHSADLNPAIWTTPLETITDNGTTKSITAGLAPGNRFFRLFKL